jgi:hypothetical protein
LGGTAGVVAEKERNLATEGAEDTENLRFYSRKKAQKAQNILATNEHEYSRIEKKIFLKLCIQQDKLVSNKREIVLWFSDKES